MTLLFVSFLAGVLTIAAPCILPLLPVIIGGSAVRGSGTKNNWYHPLIIALSLGVSVVLFTLLLKATTALLGIDQMVWQIISGIIVVLFGITFLFPLLWEKLGFVNKLNLESNKLLGKSFAQKGVAGDVLIGLSLGPVFNSCSPTYALVVASVLPASFAQGLVYLFAYAIGLSGMLLLVAYAGRTATAKLGWLADPSGIFKKVIGVLFIVVGLAIIFGLDKKIQTYVIEQGWYDPISRFERSIEM